MYFLRQQKTRQTDTRLNHEIAYEDTESLRPSPSFTYKQQKLFRVAMVKQRHLKLIEVRRTRSRISMQFNLNEIFVSLTITRYLN